MQLTDKEANILEFSRIMKSFTSFLKSSEFLNFTLNASQKDIDNFYTYLQATMLIQLKLQKKILSHEELCLFNLSAAEFLDNILIQAYEKQAHEILLKIKGSLNL